MANQSKRGISYKTGLWLVIMVVLLVGGWRLGIVASSHHLLAVVTEVGSIGQFRGNLFGNSDGSRLIFSRETETGIGTYFCETASGKTKLLFEHPEKGFGLILGMISWAPDDSLFACKVQSGQNSTRPKDEIILYKGTSGEVVQKFPANGYVWGSKFIWLSARSFAFSTYNQAWLVFAKKSDGTWVQTQAAKRFAGDGSKNLLEISKLTATSAHSIAWQQGDGIWIHDFGSDSTQKIWESTTNNLESFTYQETTGNYLLQCTDEQGPLSICFRPPRLQEKQGTILVITRGESRARYADLSLDQGKYVFAIKTGPKSEPTRFIWEGMVEYYQLAGDYLFFAGNRANETPAVWLYDVPSAEVRRLCSNQMADFKHTKISSPVMAIGTNTLGRQISYHLWKPDPVIPGKKYPVIIGQAHYIWSPNQQVASNGGYYFAMVDRATWADNIDNWPADVLGLYELLAKNPDIDTNRVYLTAFSAESADVNQVLATKPDLCRGVILFNPAAEPDLSRSHLAKMFIVGGSDDDVGSTVAGLAKYQDAAAKAGVPVMLVIQAGVQHVARSIATERERTRKFARFLLEN